MVDLNQVAEDINTFVILVPAKVIWSLVSDCLLSMWVLPAYAGLGLPPKIPSCLRWCRLPPNIPLDTSIACVHY